MELYALPSLPRASPLTAEGWDIVLHDCRAGQKYLMGLLQLKTAFWFQLPWLLVGLAHFDEQVAKQIARRAIQLFENDRRQDAHHRLTWLWLHPGGTLRKQLQAYADTPALRVEIGQPFFRMVVRLRLVIVVETTMEAKHLRMTIARRCRHIGPVRVSLSNRLLLLERWLCRDQNHIEQVVSAFSKARSLRKACMLLGVDRHPALLGNDKISRRGGTSALHTLLTSVFYHCNIMSVYRELRAAALEDKAAKDKQRRRDTKLTTAPTGPITWPMVHHKAMLDHFMCTIDRTCFYSCPSALMRLTSLSSVLEQPATKRLRAESGPLESTGDLLTGDGGASNLVYFQSTYTHVGRKKTVRTSVGAGGRLKDSDILVSVHNRLTGFGGELVLANRAATASEDECPSFLLEELSHDDKEVAQHMLRYTTANQHWTIIGLDPPAGLSDGDVASVLSEFMVKGALPGGSLPEGIALRGSAQRCAQALAGDGYVQAVGNLGY